MAWLPITPHLHVYFFVQVTRLELAREFKSHEGLNLARIANFATPACDRLSDLSRLISGLQAAIMNAVFVLLVRNELTLARCLGSRPLHWDTGASDR